MQLYNALNGSDYEESEALEVITMDDVLYIGMRNDLSFLLAGTINLYEHQSTYNANMPLRFLHYISQEYLRYVDYTEQNIYGESLIKLPTPHFVVFYNGGREMPDEKILRLSDAYETDLKEKSLEVTVRMLNINYGNNKTLMKKCSRLEEYAIFIHQVRQNLKKGMKPNKAVDEAIFYCIDCGIMVDFFKKHRFRARGYGMLEYGSDWHMYMERRDARAAGREEGRIEGMAEGRIEGRMEGMAEGRMEGMAEGEKIGAVKMCKELGISREAALDRVMEKYELQKTEAEKLIEKYW